MMLDKEREYFEKHLQELVAQYPGKIVVIKDEKFIGAFDTFDDALDAGVTRFGLANFLVRRVEQAPQPVTIPALTLGLLSASSPRPTRGSGSNS